MLDAIQVEERLCKLETEMRHVKKMMYHRDEIREQIWNDLQEELMTMVKHGFEQNEVFQNEARQRFEQNESFQSEARQRFDRIESDMSEMKDMLRQVLET